MTWRDILNPGEKGNERRSLVMYRSVTTNRLLFGMSVGNASAQSMEGPDYPILPMEAPIPTPRPELPSEAAARQQKEGKT